MDEDRPTFLTEVELPPYCFMTEAVEWVAFGRVPSMQHHVDEETDTVSDYRFNWQEMPDNFQPSYEFSWFDRLEFESLGIPISEDYFPAAERCSSENLEFIEEMIRKYEPQRDKLIMNDDGSKHYHMRDIVEEYKVKLAELTPLQAMVDAVEKQFQIYFEIACAKLFQLIAENKILVEAIDLARWEGLVEKDEYEKAAKFQVVPVSAFSLRQDWSKDEIYVEGSKYVALRVRVQDILKNRHSLLQTGPAISVHRFGSFYSSINAARTNRKRKLGRRQLIDWEVMRKHLARLITEDRAATGKENCIYELIAFAENEFGVSPGRTSVQRNLRVELDAHYAHK